MSTSNETTFNNIYELRGGRKVHLIITERSEDFVTIQIENLNYYIDRNKKIKWLIFLILFTTIYYVFSIRLTLIDVILVLCTCSVVYQIIYLIKKDTINLVKEFGLQTSTEQFLGLRTNLFISTLNIFDILINEVIVDLRVRYLLIVRTKGNMFIRKPIIPIVSHLDLSIDCLEIIYKHIKKKL